MNNRNLPVMVAARTLALLDERKARLYPDRKAFYVWAREDRAVVIFDPDAIDLGKVNRDFAHRLSTRMQGRRVVRTNSRGLFLQVGYEIPPALTGFSSAPLDLSKQPSPYHIPIGTAENGRDLWISLQEGDSFLVAGSRGMGKTGLVHGFIQALTRGGGVDVYAFDGKRGTEFGRYAGVQNFHLAMRLGETLAALKAESLERRRRLLKSGYPNAQTYSEAHPDSPMRPVAVIVDEAALLSDEEKAALVELVERERDTGFHPIIATNRPEASALLMKSNLVTRISFAVPSWNSSQMALGMNGAESLEKIQGRGLLVYRAHVVKFQSFRVEYPAPSPEALASLLNEEDAPQGKPAGEDIEKLAEAIRPEWHEGMSGRAVGALLGKPYGGSWKDKIDKIVEVLRNSSMEGATA